MDASDEIILYQPDDAVKIEVRVDEETVWLTQQQMTMLFETTKQNVSLHINNIFKEEELSPVSAVKEYLTVQREGNRTIKRIQKYYNLDGLYAENDDGSPLPAEEEVKWFRMAAEQEYAPAQYFLGVYYANGDGVQQSYEEAVKWYRLAAEQEYAPAQRELGICYAVGNGIEQSYNEAAKWFRMAAEQDFPRAQYILGLMYNEGIGVKRNKKEALYWATKAYDQGYEDAYDLIKGITRK